MRLNDKIKVARESKEWTQEDLAKVSGVSLPSIKRYESTNDNNITLNNLQKIANALNCELTYFLESEYSESQLSNTEQTTTMTGAEFKEIREKLGMTQDELSKATGINIRQISRIETGIAEVRDYQEKLMMTLLENKDRESSNDTIKIPIYDVIASAGGGAINDECVIEHISVSKIMLKTFFHLSNTQNLSIITAKGDSMEPTIPQGSQLLVQQRQVMEGEICVCRIDDELYVKRLQKLPRFVLLSDNPRYEPIPLNSRDFEVIGAVVGVFIKFSAR